jgi:pantoate--beta-alanine ligase
MNITIIGIGAMGCLFGAYLSRAANVMLLGHWPEQVAALRQNGLRLLGPDGQERHYWLNVTTSADQSPPADLVLVLVKSYQTGAAATAAAQVLAPEGVVVTLQNGLGNVAQLTAVLDPTRVTLGITAQGATLLQPGLLRHAGHGPTHLVQTEKTAVPFHQVVQRLAHLLQQAGLETHLVEDANGLVWGKLAVNAAINPLTALLNVPNGFLAQNPTARKFMFAAAREAAAVAQGLGITLPYPDAAQRALQVAQATAANYSSMCQDVRRGRPTEIEAICGNPTQFGPQDDFDSYPRDLERDLDTLRQEEVDLVFTPSDKVMYPEGFETAVTVQYLTNRLEGAARPTHFQGVTTIVAKLFNLIQPRRAYFGQKDAQQTIILRRMVQDLNFNLEVIICPTVREADGLALSSRNKYLNPAQRQAATVLYRALQAAQTAYDSGERRGQPLRQIMTETVTAEPLARLEYVSVAHPHTLFELDDINGDALLSLAVRIGNTRLIDNILLPQ